VSKTYDCMAHSHVTINHPKPRQGKEEDNWIEEAWEGVFDIVLHAGTHVWIAGSYCAEGHAEVKRVGDGRSNGYDVHGSCILSVPAEWCSFWTFEEAESIEQMRDADERLLSYAR
jgi:hypothetical protein